MNTRYQPCCSEGVTQRTVPGPEPNPEWTEAKGVTRKGLQSLSLPIAPTFADGVTVLYALAYCHINDTGPGT
jgi:hypothetical protein